MVSRRVFHLSLRGICLLAAAVVPLYYFRSSIRNSWVIFRMPIVWNKGSSEFLVSKEKDNFDVTFLNYSKTRDSSLPDYPDVVPPILHHIALGKLRVKTSWVTARESCLQYHPGWKTYLWTDENSPQFVEQHFPNFKSTWDSYKYPVQRIDALRYLVLYYYGGAVLDMDLNCTRSLGPLRRFSFVAPAAHPAGFSIGMMMASKEHAFVGELIRNLPVFEQWWFGVPYATVMFSTGCHYASAIHTLQANRTDLKVLTGPPEAPKMHNLNGDVVTPLFHHLGTSSWHSYDGSLIVSLGRRRTQQWILCGFVLGLVVAALIASRFQRRRLAHYVSFHRRILRYRRGEKKSQADVLIRRIA